MKHACIFKSTALFVLWLVVGTIPSVGEGADVKRYFHRGDGSLNLVNAKSGVSFKGEYRSGNGSYDDNGLRAIHRAFGVEDYGEPISTVSLRLIEFIDFLEDRFQPGARITIVSGYRSPEYNTALRNKGGLAAKASLHQYGMAADLEMQGVPARAIWNYVKELGFGGAGYYHGELVHVDVGPARSWDENTSGVGTDISVENKLIGVVTDYDVYLPGETVTLRFIRMTAFPIGVATEWAMDRVEEGAGTRKVASFKPSFAVEPKGGCPQFGDIGEMLGIRYDLPRDIPPGRYKIRAGFCKKEWEAMPAEISTPEFEIVRP
jgi:uncharacterized protein YcbK (DUF882 family)